MKTIIALFLTLAASSALAIGQPPAEPVSATAHSSATSSASTGPIDLSLMNAPGGNGHTYVFPPPAAAAPLPTGLCPKGDSEAWSAIWGFISYSKSSTRTEHECLDKVLAYLREAAPRPAAPPVVNYITNPPAVVAQAVPQQECTKPVPKKQTKAAVKPSVCK